MSLLFLVLPFVLIFLIIAGRGGSSAGLRHSLLSAFVIWILLLVGITEILSAFDLLTRYGLIVLWATIGAVSGICIFQRPVRVGFFRPRSRNALCGMGIMFLTGIALITLATFIIALTAPPNTWDSMTYHMSRVMHWIQNQNVKHYPTNIGQQVFLPPLAEYVITHFQILIGHDRFANMVQWGAMVGSAVGLSLIAKELGAGFPTQLLASFLGVTLPMGILQSTSTQNDYFAAFWLIALSYFLLRLQKEPTWRHAAMSGISLGLAWLTKPTAYLYCIPFLTLASWTLLKKSGFKALGHMVLVGTLALSMNIPHFSRNVASFGHPFGPKEYQAQNRSQIISLGSFTSNVVRNLALHMALPWPQVNRLLENGVIWLHHLIGPDVNDERTTFGPKFGIVFANHEDLAGNLAHLALVLFSSFLLFFSVREDWFRPCSAHLLCVAVSFGLLCTFIKWNPWNSRYHLALFLLAAPAMAIIFEQWINGGVLRVLVALFLVGSLAWVACNRSRPLLIFPPESKFQLLISPAFDQGKNIFTTPRPKQYFSNRPELREAYFAAADYLTAKGIKKIGIALGGDDWEYPFFPLLRERAQAPIRIEHVLRGIGSGNQKARSKKGFVPEAIICLTSDAEDMLQLGDTRFQEAEVFGPVRIFLPES